MTSTSRFDYCAPDDNRDAAMKMLADAAGPVRVSEYIVDTMLALRSGTLPVSPWHAVIHVLGGNASVDSWNHMPQGKNMPRAPLIACRLFRRI